ncbi:glycoside hydrolase family 28 protein [Rhizodiscina lignyota]|uniref:Glycoside hydrolase family 28 protein n=1 Tax=Rhizodiscina lignyota TaxID=1504668 RepID=A0A9P4MBR9_9PEZI|nr:glycoside hydrolase family 28 protein [Rhizodiscina lignyota]
MRLLTLCISATLLSCVSAKKSCVMPKSKSGGDDTPGIVKAISQCGNDSSFWFSAHQTYNLYTPLNLSNLGNVEFLFESNITIPKNVTEVQAIVNDTSVYPGHWITIKGSNIVFKGSGRGGEGWFLAHGEEWWATGNQIARPHWFSFNGNDLQIMNLNILNPVAWVFSIGGTNIHMKNLVLDARSTNGFPFNTDGVDCSASNVLIENFDVANGDDVINVSPPAQNVTLRNVRAQGSHGISVSCSAGSGGNYLFENIEISDSLFGARFKGVLGTTCNISDVTWKNMVIKNSSYPIHFIENYVDQEQPVTGDPSVAAYAKDFTYENIVGTSSNVLEDGSCISDPCWSFTTGQSPEKAIYLLCNNAEHCKDFHFKGIDLKTPGGKPAGEECIGLNGVTGMGITCTNGTIIPER